MRVLLDTNVVIAAVATRGLCQDVMQVVLGSMISSWVVAAALHGKADVLVTGDDDLLSVTSNFPIAIVSPRGFWEMLRGPRRPIAGKR